MHPNVKVLIEREYDAQKSEAWLKLRGNMLTASDAATAIGKNKYETPEGLLLKKCGLGEKFTGNAATRHGEKYEDEARIIYEQRHGEIVHEIGLCPHQSIVGLVEVLTVSVNLENLLKLSVHHKGRSFQVRYPNITCHNFNSVWKS